MRWRGVIALLCFGAAYTCLGVAFTGDGGVDFFWIPAAYWVGVGLYFGLTYDKGIR